MAPAPPPEVSYAWVTFDGQGIRGSGADGAADRAAGRRVTIDDPVRIASVSKLVVALGVMRLAEQGRLDLDEDVSVKLGWRLRNPAFPDRRITLRLLLSHRSSIRDQGDNYVIPLGQTVEAMLVDPASFDGEHAPGTFFRYSNLNFPVIASVMERASGERFDRLIDRLVLDPLGLDACFNWSTCSDAALARAVVLYEEDGSALRDDLKGKRPECLVLPAADGSCDLNSYVLGTNGALFSPQGGLRISARDLATVGQLLLNKGRHRGQLFLSPASIETMTLPAWRYDGTNGATDEGFYCAYGLGVQLLPVAGNGCRDDLFNGRSMVGHAGDAYRVRSGLWVDQRRGVGIAFLSANNGKDPPRGRTAYRAVEEWLAAKLD
ncbi:MAG TPA: serine hydrolase [Allosphingosinicella sp.]|uniref:serine hydrolase domain-containing protein n=1 Tax=Allosphingosinicella sp. TaxID=2823234 RepID=UPI002ED7A1EA